MRWFLLSAATAALLTVTLVRAEPVDMAKIRCDDLTHAYIDQFVVIDAWLSGYYHAKSNKTVVDIKQVAANTRKVLQFCKENPGVTVMQAVERLTASGG